MKKRLRGWVYYGDDAYGEEPGETKGDTIHEPEGAFDPQPTGVLNAKGEMIYRQPERIGFALRRK